MKAIIFLGLLLGILSLSDVCNAMEVFDTDALRTSIAEETDEELAVTMDEAFKRGISLREADYLVFAREIYRRKSDVLADSTHRLFDRFVHCNFAVRKFRGSGYIRPSKDETFLPKYVKEGCHAEPLYSGQDKRVVRARERRTKEHKLVVEVFSKLSTKLVIWKRLPGWQIAGSKKGYDDKKWTAKDDWKLMADFSWSDPERVAAYFRLMAPKNVSGGDLWSAAVEVAKRSPAARRMAFMVGIKLPRPPGKELMELCRIGARDRNAAIVGPFLAWLEVHLPKRLGKQRERYARGAFAQRWSLAEYDIRRYCPYLHAYKREAKTGAVVFLEEQRYLKAQVSLIKVLADKNATSKNQLKRFKFAIDHGLVLHRKAVTKLVGTLQQMAHEDRLEGFEKLTWRIGLRSRQKDPAARSVARQYARALTTVEFDNDDARIRAGQMIRSIYSSMKSEP